MDKLADQLAELVAKIQGPAYQLAREAARVQAYSNLTSTIFFEAVGLACLTVPFVLWRYRKTIIGNERDDNEFFILLSCLAGVAFGIIGLITTLNSIFYMIDPWTWASINNPELALARKILKL